MKKRRARSGLGKRLSALSDLQAQGLFGGAGRVVLEGDAGVPRCEVRALAGALLAQLRLDFGVAHRLRGVEFELDAPARLAEVHLLAEVVQRQDGTLRRLGGHERRGAVALFQLDGVDPHAVGWGFDDDHEVEAGLVLAGGEGDFGASPQPARVF